jgi:hypothetical protein
MTPIGTRFNRFTTLAEPYRENGKVWVAVSCDCSKGEQHIKQLPVIKAGLIKSCGCLRSEAAKARNLKSAKTIAIGTVYGRLTTLEEPKSVDGYRYVSCLCVCGKTAVATLSSLECGTRKSCGCLKSEVLAERNYKHGKSKDLIYRVWASMRERCNSPNCASYANYGGRGITVSEAWDTSFEKFYADMGDAPFKGATLEREDNSKGYCKENVRWATRAEQVANTRRNVLYEFNGEKRMLKDIAKATGINLGTLYYRINKMGLSLSDALVGLV